MRKPLLVLVLLALAFGGGSCARLREVPPEAAPPAEPQRCDLPQLKQELDRLEAELPKATGERANCLIRLARTCFFLGDLSPKGAQQSYFERGRGHAETLAREQPAWAEGHYWLGLNLCGLAEVGGARKGLLLLPRIIEEFERALAVNPGYDQAGAHRVLGRIYYEAPAWPLSVGDLHQARRHLRAAVALAPDNSSNHLYLGLTLLKQGEKAAARRELEQVLTATRHAVCPQDLEEDRREARRLLRENR